MRPFQASYPQFANQQQVLNPNPSVVNMNSMCSNQRPSHSNTPHFPAQSNNPLSNGNVNFLSAQNPHFENVNSYQQVPMQNMQMGLSQAQFSPQNVAPQCHGHHHTNPQNLIMPQPSAQFLMNSHPQITNMPFGQFNLQNLPPHPNQISGLPRGQFPQQHLGFSQVNQFNMPPFIPHPLGLVNQGAQNVGFQMNAQSGMLETNQFPHNAQGQNMFVPSTIGQNPLQVSSLNGQHAQAKSVNGGHAQFPQTQNGMHSGVIGQVQGNNTTGNGSNIRNAYQTNPQGKDTNLTGRFQKPGAHPMSNTKGNFRSFKGKGPNDKGSTNFHLAKCTKQDPSIESPSSRTLPLNYSEDEVQKWRAERRKNHPSRPKSEKIQSEIIANDAQKRRQELKEILAKQAELGVEVAEIPKHLLLDNQPEQKEFSSNGNGKSRKRGGGRRQKQNRFNKKQKTDSSSPKPQQKTVKKKPSLLEKLLSGDIKRDKSHLLQAFRFMALNNFFREYPKKALEFPSVKVKDVKNASPHSQGESNGSVSAIKKTVMVDDDENAKVVCEEVKEGEGEGSEVEEGDLTE